MFKPLEVCIGLRYTRSKRRSHFISFMSSSSMLGIALGVAALITVLSVMNGFERELRERILGMASHATITGSTGTIGDWPALAQAVSQHAHVVGVAPFVEGQAMLTRGQSVHGAVVRGVLPQQEPKVSEIGLHMVEGELGELRDGAFRIVLGRGLARALGVGVGGKVTLLAPTANVSAAGVLPRLRRFTVTGVFEVGHAQYDSALALVHLRDAQRLFSMQDKVSGLRLKVDDLYAAPRVSRELARDLAGRYRVRDWTQIHANIFRALRTEKTVMSVILTLIVAVAAFNLVSALTMVVTDKASDIAILRTLGSSPGSVLAIFLVQGTVIGLAGTMLGALGGIVLASNVKTIVPAIEHLFHTKFLSPDVYYISEVPSDLHRPDVLLTCAVALVLASLATVYPAWRASRIQPAEALRYE